MTTDKVRIIDKKGDARFVMPHIAKNKSLMKSYGYRVEDLNTKEEEIAIQASEVDKGEDDLGFQDLTAIEVPKGKPGRKPNLKK